LLADTIPAAEAFSIVQSEKQIYASGSLAYLKKLDQLELLILRRRLNTLPQGSVERAETARAILIYLPADPDALSVLAWHKFNHKDYRGAAELFSRLRRMQPDNKAHALGLGYCRLNLGEYDTALLPLQELNITDDSETLALKKRVYEEQANTAYKTQKWSQAADNFEKVLSIDPEDEDAKQLLAWARYHQERYAEARTLMEETYERKKTSKTAGQLFDIYAGTNAEKAAYDLARDLSQKSQPGMKAMAADFYFNHQAPITAAHVVNSPQKCYFNASSPRLEAFLYHRNKDGDSGFSKLEETASPITAVLPAKVGKIWSFSVTPKYLSSGNAPDQPFAGRFYSFLNGAPQQNDLEDSLIVWQPDIGFEKEGRISTSIHVGSTPFNGAVEATPTFDLKFSDSKWFVDLHRWNVKDSILSYTGLEDPYSNSEWGRVTRNGITAGYTWSFLSDYWLSGNLGYNFYDGYNVWDNDSYHLDIAVGRTLSRNRDEIAYGLFFSGQHYRRNSDFFTFGHGGYYSPEVMTMAGPFFRYRSALCRDYWFDFQAAVGWLHQELDGSPFYPRFDGDITGLNPVAAANAIGDYDSKTKNELGYSFHLQGMKLLNHRLAAGGFLTLEKNTDYTQWQIGVGMQFFFDPQNLFWARKDFFNEFGSNSNK
jgi:tetratricopeptide (TPR) repeat protein